MSPRQTFTHTAEIKTKLEHVTVKTETKYCTYVALQLASLEHTSAMFAQNAMMENVVLL